MNRFLCCNDNFLIREFPCFTPPQRTGNPESSSAVDNFQSSIINFQSFASSLANTIPSFSKSFLDVPFFGTLLKPLILLVFTFSWHALAFGLKVH
jgi:hypothetical protein